MRPSELVVQQGVSLLLAQRGGRSVPMGELLRWTSESGLSVDDTLRAIDALVHKRELYRDAEGWRPRYHGLQTRGVDAMADRARFRA